MKFTLFITGCQYNYYDAKNITHFLYKVGYIYTKNEKEADLIIVLACSVKQKPIDRIYGKIKVWKNYIKNPKIIVTACVLQRDHKTLSKKVDAVMDIKNFEKIFSKKLYTKLTNKNINPDKEFFPKDFHDNKKSALITIMQGCNNFCTYCAVPYTRGREVSKKESEILNETINQLKIGKNFISYIGQNVNSYKNPITKKIHKNSNSFCNLLKKIDSLPYDFTYNFMSANPRNFSEELIELLPKLKKWQPIIHIPLQSGDDIILKKMNRKYQVLDYLNLIGKLKSKIKNIKITTDIIVGFPSETDEQFQNTYRICSKIGFHKVYVSQYSPRFGTKAAIMQNQINNCVKLLPQFFFHPKPLWLFFSQKVVQILQNLLL